MEGLALATCADGDATDAARAGGRACDRAPLRPVFGFRNIGVLQHWQSAKDLHAYAHQAGGTHLAAWRRFNKKIGTSGDVGIWHETYVVPAGHSESVYVNMPGYGLGVAGTLHPAKGARASARKRLAATRS